MLSESLGALWRVVRLEREALTAWFYLGSVIACVVQPRYVGARTSKNQRNARAHSQEDGQLQVELGLGPLLFPFLLLPHSPAPGGPSAPGCTRPAGPAAGAVRD